ncbi:uncharacterized protein [Asterias amurensis]|uniref:uncharacterized protein n=1 Tax=Asterias amurensis TaxID=7602 RepID=UPI003AB6ABB1
MAGLSYSVLLVCTLSALVQIGAITNADASTDQETCASELPSNCCAGKDGMITAPDEWPANESPAGGPEMHSSAVVCVLYRMFNCLVCRTSNLSVSICVETVTIDDTMFGGPLPLNEYLIGKARIHPTENTDWYDLFPRHEVTDNLSYYGYNEPTATGRSGLNLHRGARVDGCETTPPATDDDGTWPEIMTILNEGDMTHDGSMYSGFLYVVMDDPVGLV